MIKAILIFNNQGKARLTKFYQHYSEKEKQGMIEVMTPFFLKGTNFCAKLDPLNDFSLQRSSYKLEAEEGKNQRAFDFQLFAKYVYCSYGFN